MQMQFLKLTLFAALSAILIGCASSPSSVVVYSSTPSVVETPIEFIDAKISADCLSNGCQSFTLKIENRSSKTVEINWNKTLFVAANQSSGGFMFEGVVIKDRNAPKPPDVIFAKSSVSKTIWPNNLVEWDSYSSYPGWRNRRMPVGEVGMYLTVTVDGKDYSQKITTIISATEKMVKR